MINEPMYWSADCDLFLCKKVWTLWDPDGRENEEDIVQSLRADGWIVVDYEVFCSLDHFLTYRASPTQGEWRRKNHSESARHHGDLNHRGQRCCHGFHATHHYNGLGHDFSCPDYRKVSWAAKKEALRLEAEAKQRETSA